MGQRAHTQGKLLYGIAADDEHTLTNPGGALPGRARIMVELPALNRVSLPGDRQWRLYASTGITLQSYEVSSSAISIAIDDSAATTIDFIGRNGRCCSAPPVAQRLTSSPVTSSTYAPSL